MASGSSLSNRSAGEAVAKTGVEARSGHPSASDQLPANRRSAGSTAAPSVLTEIGGKSKKNPCGRLRKASMVGTFRIRCMFFEQVQSGSPATGAASHRGVVAKTVAVVLAVGAVSASTARAATIPVPNASFESPPTLSVDLQINSWQKTPKPEWWDEAQYGAWDQLVGAFANVAPGDPRHIENCDGNQAIWVFANPGAGLFQDYDSVSGSNGVPSHAFEAQYEPGKSYRLTVGVLVGTAYPMAEGSTLELSLYYRDAASNRVTVAATTATNTPNVFSNAMRLIDFQVDVPQVQPGDAWAGQHIGVAILSTADPLQPGGYWDVDNVRLAANVAPALLQPVLTNGHFGFQIEGEVGMSVEILASSDLSLPLSSWTNLGALTNDTGSAWFSNPATNQALRFFQARQLP